RIGIGKADMDALADDLRQQHAGAVEHDHFDVEFLFGPVTQVLGEIQRRMRYGVARDQTENDFLLRFGPPDRKDQRGEEDQQRRAHVTWPPWRARRSAPHGTFRTAARTRSYSRSQRLHPW